MPCLFLVRIMITDLTKSHFYKILFCGTMYSAKEDLLMKEQKRILELTDFEWRLLVGCLNTARSAYLDEGKPIEDVNTLLIKVMNAKLKKVRI